jgi:catechol 2,3-dioxygenase-like lactoylglutathione lyase family enzyme
MANIEGIGGVFIYSTDAKRLADWYQSALGIKMEVHPEGASFYKVFHTRDLRSGEVRENPVFAINSSNSVPEAGQRGYMLNLRVNDLDEYLEQLKALDVTIEDKILEWEGGKHAWIWDLDGNKIELYEELLIDPVSQQIDTFSEKNTTEAEDGQKTRF